MSTFYRASDLPYMLKQFGVPVEVWYLGEPTAAYGLMDTEDDELAQHEGSTLVGKVNRLTIQTGAFPSGAIAKGQTITVEGVDYKIASTRQMEDGALTRVYLAR